MMTKFKYSNKVMVDVLVPSQDFVYYKNNNKSFIKVECSDGEEMYSNIVSITKKNSFLWKGLPFFLRNNKDFKKFCKKVWRVRGFA